MNIQALEAVALSVRTLSMDGVQKANSGHPGMPMGMAELGALLYGEILKHYPKNPDWINRDRFVLSTGHGSMFLYSLLHLSGYPVKKEDLMNFRQLGSCTAGHPEYGMLKGVETTTGPLGQGIANAVGMALAERMLAARFNTKDRTIVDHYTYAIVGDGCLMEGVSAEAASLAGHLGLGKLIVFYDSNRITIEGSTDLAFTEKVTKRFEAYGWQTLKGDAYDMPGIMSLVEKAKAETGKPTLIELKSIIGKGSPNLAGSHKVHGSPLGEDEVKATRKHLGVPENKAFFIHPDAVAYFKEKAKTFKEAYDAWNQEFKFWAKENPTLKKEWDIYFGIQEKISSLIKLPEFKIGDKIATRSASGKVIQALADCIPNLVGGSADLAPSNNTALPKYGDIAKNDFSGRTIHFGVREHGMGAIVNGMTLHGGFRAFCATFLVFCDYMRPSIRLAALMKIPVTYIFTHDSIYVGEDGPTHQPIEHAASLRIIPNMRVLRPGDAQETAVAWKMAMEHAEGPTALLLTRQNLTVYEKADVDWADTVSKRGAYIVKDTDGKPDVVIVATGSEVNLALAAAKELPGKKIRIVSMLSMELFLEQDEAFKASVLPAGVRVVTAEAGVSYGWDRIATSHADILAIDRFGECGPGEQVAAHLGLTPESLKRIIER